MYEIQVNLYFNYSDQKVTEPLRIINIHHIETIQANHVKKPRCSNEMLEYGMKRKLRKTF